MTNPDERRKRVHSTLVEFGQMHQLIDPTSGNDKPQQDVDALIKNMVDEKVSFVLLSNSIFSSTKFLVQNHYTDSEFSS